MPLVYYGWKGNSNPTLLSQFASFELLITNFHCLSDRRKYWSLMSLVLWNKTIANKYLVVLLHAILHCLAFLFGLLWGKEPIMSVAIPVRKYRGKTFRNTAVLGTNQLRTLWKHFGRRGWGYYWGFLTSSSYCQHCRTVLLWTLTHLDSKRCNACNFTV